VRILLELLGELDRLLYVEQPLLGCLLVLAGVYLFVRLLDREVEELFFHVECLILV
jgi:hypothetical protein